MKRKTGSHERSPIAFWVNIFLVLVATVLSGILFFKKPTRDPDPSPDNKSNTTAIAEPYMASDLTLMSMIGMCLWPVLFDITVGYKIIAQCPLLVFVFLWPLMTGYLEQLTAGEKKLVLDEDNHVKSSTVKGDIVVLITIAFILVTLMNSKRAQVVVRHTSPLMIVALLLVIAFIVPTGDLSTGQHHRRALLFQSGQKICLNWAVGAVLGVLVLLLCAFQNKCYTGKM